MINFDQLAGGCVGQLPLFSPTDLNTLSDCTLKFSFFQQVDAYDAATYSAVTDNEAVDEIQAIQTLVLHTIQHLHASGGPFRLNLPATLRAMDQFLPQTEVNLKDIYVTARQILANYHRQLKAEWSQVIASNETMALTIRLRRAVVQVEENFDRVDKATDGGVTGLKFIVAPEMFDVTRDAAIEATILHALIAATYPGRRPVRIAYRWLYQNKTTIIELTEKQFRQNLAKMKERVQAWQDGEILARPGPYCESCPFQFDGCPLFDSDYSDDIMANDDTMA